MIITNTSVFAITVVMTPVLALADSISIQMPKSTYLLYEPIIVHVTLELDEPYRFIQDDPAEATRERRRVRRHLSVLLHDEEHVLCESFLGGGGVAPGNEDCQRFEASTFALLGDLIPERNESRFQFWDTAGNYWVSVVDRDNGLESPKLAITVVDPPITAKAAASLFRSSGLDIWLAFLGSEEGKRARSVLQELGNAHRTTVYGRYANAVICLRDADPRFRSEVAKITDFDSKQLFKRLKSVVESFDPGHPMRTQALFRMAGLQAGPSVGGDADVTIQQLMNECSDSSWTKEAEDWLQASRKRRTIRGK